MIFFFNGTSRYVFPPLTMSNTTYQNATALSFVDSIQN